MSDVSPSSKWSCHAPYFCPAVGRLPSLPAPNAVFCGKSGVRLFEPKDEDVYIVLVFDTIAAKCEVTYTHCESLSNTSL